MLQVLFQILLRIHVKKYVSSQIDFCNINHNIDFSSESALCFHVMLQNLLQSLFGNTSEVHTLQAM